MMKTRKFGPAGLLAAAVGLCTLAPALAADSAFDDANAPPKPTWEYAQLRSQVPVGDKMGTFATGWCLSKTPMNVTAKSEEYANGISAIAFKQLAKAIDLNLFQKDVSPFASDAPASADLRVGGTLLHEDGDWCVDNRKAKGETNVEVRWEVWSAKQQRVVLTKTTTGHFKTDEPVSNIESPAFQESLKAMFDSPEAKDLIAGKLPAAK